MDRWFDLHREGARWSRAIHGHGPQVTAGPPGQLDLPVVLVAPHVLDRLVDPRLARAGPAHRDWHRVDQRDVLDAHPRAVAATSAPTMTVAGLTRP
jgi:hypothetical protein